MALYNVVQQQLLVALTNRESKVLKYTGCLNDDLLGGKFRGKREYCDTTVGISLSFQLKCVFFQCSYSYYKAHYCCYYVLQYYLK